MTATLARRPLKHASPGDCGADDGAYKTGLIVVQPTPFCNIDCSYCYLGNRTDKSVMSVSTLENLFTKVFTSGLVVGEVTVVWHAGEPMVVSPDFYEKAFSIIEARRPSDVRVIQSFQTNATLIDDRWCDFIRARDIKIGVSLDGPRELHDAHRRTRAGRGTFDRVMAGVEKLQAHDIEFSVICVLTAQSLERPVEMFDFFVSHGIKKVGFNVEEQEGAHGRSSLNQLAALDVFSNFVRTFWGLAATTKRIAFVREMEELFSLIVRPNGTVITNAQTEPFRMISVDWQGNFTTFSPELLGQHHPVYGDFTFGNVNADEILDSTRTARFQSLNAEIQQGVRECERRCGYFSVCGGGAPANKLAENGTMASTETMFCRMTKQIPCDIALEMIEATALD